MQRRSRCKFALAKASCFRPLGAGLHLDVLLHLVSTIFKHFFECENRTRQLREHPAGRNVGFSGAARSAAINLPKWVPRRQSSAIAFLHMDLAGYSDSTNESPTVN